MNNCMGECYVSLDHNLQLSVKLCELQEGQTEKGTFLTCPAVCIHKCNTKDGSSLEVTWDPDLPADNSQEIWKTESNTRLSLVECLNGWFQL